MAVAPGQVHQHSFKMMADGLDRPQSALLRGVQITEFKDSKVNPQPIVLEESDVLLQEYLSPRKLRLLTGVENLDSVRSLEMRVDTSDTSLGNFGAMLPNLSQLKLSNSVITSIRDLGSSLRNLQVLWMSRCGLQELDGLSSMSRLRELYLSYNEISDLSPVSMLENLQILDLEGNNIEDIKQIQYLELCSSLRSLTLEANPVCVMSSPDSQELNYDYRFTIRNMLPQIASLDDEPVINIHSKKTNVFDDDWAFLEELQKDLSLQNLNSLDNAEDETTSFPARPNSGARLLTGYRPGSALRPSSGMKPLTGSRQKTPSGVRPKTRGSPGSSSGRPGSATRPSSTDDNEVADSASSLTTGGVICGNPVRALRSRRGDSTTPPGKESTPKLFEQYRHKAEHTYDPVTLNTDDNQEILAELKAWREHHDKLIRKIEEERAPQVLAIVPDETHDWSESDDITDSEEEAEDFDVELGVQPLSGSTLPLSPENRPTCQPPAGRAMGRPEFRSRRYHPESKDTAGSDRPSNGRVLTRPQVRHDESFEDDDLSSPGHSVAGPKLSTAVCSDTVNDQSPTPTMIPSKPAVPSIPRQSVLDRHSDHEPLRTGHPAPVGAVKSAGGTTLPGRPVTSRAALALPSQMRIKRQLPTVPPQQSKSREGK